MGPGTSSSKNVPGRPRFSWDTTHVPWTDGKGNQEEYADAVRQWEAYHDLLPDGSSNKAVKKIRGVLLLSQLYGRAKDVCRSIPADVIQSEKGVEAIVAAVYRRDPLAVVTDVYHDFMALLQTKRGPSESVMNYESRFNAQLSRWNSLGKETRLSEALVAFILLANANVDASQKVSVLAHCAPKNDTLTSTSTTSDYLKAVSYESIASVLRQCGSGVKHETGNALQANSASSSDQNHEQRSRNRQRRTPEQRAAAKANVKCYKSGKFGHYQSEHREDGSLKPGTVANDSPPKSEERKNSLTFNMVQVCTEGFMSGVEDCIGPLLDDGAPYSGIGEEELNLIRPIVCPEWKGTLEPIPDAVKDRPFWQYGKGEHSSDCRRILESVIIEAKTDEGSNVRIRHLVIEGSTQWVIGRNVTQHCNIQHIGGNALVLPCDSGGEPQGRISLVNHDMHSYVPHSAFTSRAQPITEKHEKILFCAMASMGDTESTRPWSELKKIVDKVHKHVCGHAVYSDIKILLQRNGIWTEGVNKYLARVLEDCTHCSTTSLPKSARKVSLSSISRSFNEVVCVDHLFLDDVCVFHIMDTASRYSAGCPVESTSMENVMSAFEALWVSPFWNPKAVLYDQGFNTSAFRDYLDNYDIEKRPVPSRRHNKNVLESKHRVIRDIYERLKSERHLESKREKHILVRQALRISNDLYGSDTLSANELAKGYTIPVDDKFPYPIPQELVDAHDSIVAKRKLTLIFWTSFWWQKTRVLTNPLEFVS